jgi:hypothetical protein
MFSTSEFYSYCRVHDVDVIPFDRLPAAATTVRYHGAYAVGLNFSRLHTVRQIRTAMLHESGHLHTGALHKVNSPFQLVEQNEYRAELVPITRDNFVSLLHIYRDGDINDSKYLASLFETFLVRVDLYDDHFLIWFNPLGQKTPADIPITSIENGDVDEFFDECRSKNVFDWGGKWSTPAERTPEWKMPNQIFPRGAA